MKRHIIILCLLIILACATVKAQIITNGGTINATITTTTTPVTTQSDGNGGGGSGSTRVIKITSPSPTPECTGRKYGVPQGTTACKIYSNCTELPNNVEEVIECPRSPAPPEKFINENNNSNIEIAKPIRTLDEVEQKEEVGETLTPNDEDISNDSPTNSYFYLIPLSLGIIVFLGTIAYVIYEYRKQKLMVDTKMTELNETNPQDWKFNKQ